MFFFFLTMFLKDSGAEILHMIHKSKIFSFQDFQSPCCCHLLLSFIAQNTFIICTGFGVSRWPINNMVGIEAIAVNEQFLLFPQCFPQYSCNPLPNNKIMHSFKLHPFPNKPWFVHVCSTSLLKTLQEK